VRLYGEEALGRLASGWLVGRVGNRRTLLGSGALAAVGMLLALATTSSALVVGGFLLVGLALAAVAPLAFSVAGDLVPGRAGAAVSVVTTVGYGGFLLGPPLVGGLAEAIGLRAALGIIAVAGVAVFALSLRACGNRGRRPRPKAASEPHDRRRARGLHEPTCPAVASGRRRHADRGAAGAVFVDF
jgi:MFS family permease